MHANDSIVKHLANTPLETLQSTNRRICLNDCQIDLLLLW